MAREYGGRGQEDLATILKALMSSLAHALPLAILAAFLFGCSSNPHAAAPRPGEPELGDVRTATAARTGAEVRWCRDDADERAAHDAVRQLLEGELSADRAVQIALLNNAALQATFEEIGIARADVTQAGLLRNPVLSIDSGPPDHPPSGTNIEGSVVFDFVDLLFMNARKRLAATQLAAAKLRVSASAVALAADVRSAFYAYQGAQQMLEMHRTVVEAVTASAETARELRDKGNLSDLAADDEQSMLEQARLDLAAAEADTADARERLNELLGLWGPSTQWTIAARLPDPPADEVPPQGLESLAVSQRLDLLAAARQGDASDAQLGFTRASRLLAEGQVGISVEHDTNGQTIYGPSLSLPVPLFDMGQGRVERAAAELRRDRQSYAALAVQVRADVRKARNRLYAARDRAQYLKRIVLPLRHRIVEESQRRNNGMLLGVFQLLEARRGEIDAGRQYIESLRDYWMARTDLERAVGGKLPATQSEVERAPSLGRGQLVP
jgi:cobalt-zinc-cadmium efflux system outer membrane protein